MFYCHVDFDKTRNNSVDWWTAYDKQYLYTHFLLLFILVLQYFYRYIYEQLYNVEFFNKQISLNSMVVLKSLYFSI